MNKPCPICGAPYGFHDEGPHDARPCPPHLLLEVEKPDKDLCHCGERFGTPGAPQCRHPKHTKEVAA